MFLLDWSITLEGIRVSVCVRLVHNTGGILGIICVRLVHNTGGDTS